MEEEAQYPPNAKSSRMETIEEEEDDFSAEFELEDKIDNQNEQGSTGHIPCAAARPIAS